MLIKVINNFDHNHNITLVNSNDVQDYNHFGYDLTDKVLILPLFNVSYLNVKNYLKIYEGHYKLDDIYNIVVMNQLFSSNSKISYNSLIYMTDIIKNLEESNYWTRKYNCLLNISKKFASRTSLKLSLSGASINDSYWFATNSFLVLSKSLSLHLL